MNIEDFVFLYKNCPICKEKLNFNINFTIFDSEAIASYMMEDKFLFKKSFLHHATTVDSIIHPKNIKLQSYSETVYEDSSEYFSFNPEIKRSYFLDDYKDSKKTGVSQFQYGHFESSDLNAKCKKSCIRYSSSKFSLNHSFNIKNIVVTVGKYSLRHIPASKEVHIYDFSSLKRYSFAPSSLDLWPLEEYKLETRLLAMFLLK